MVYLFIVNRLCRPFLLLVVAMFSLLSVARGQDVVNIEGVSLLSNQKSVFRLFEIENGHLQEIASSVPNANGNFGFCFYPEKAGFFLIGTGNGNQPDDNYIFWLNKNDRLRLNFNDSGYHLVNGYYSPENAAMSEWFKTCKDLMNNSVYLRRNGKSKINSAVLFKNTENARTLWLSKRKKTNNKTFEQLLPWLTYHDVVYFKSLNLLSVFSNNFLQFDLLEDQVGDVYKQTYDVYGYPWGRAAFEQFVRIKSLRRNAPLKTDSSAFSTLSNDTLKGFYCLDKLKEIKAYDKYLQVLETYKEHLLTEDQKREEFFMQNKIRKINAGDQAYNFRYTDTSGNIVTFNGMLGKVVVVDLWATWCGPCMHELPYLNEVEKQFDTKDVAFVSISVDDKRDLEKWKKTIKQNNMEGIQLFASGWSDITRYYNVQGIPRFMVFDKKGRIVSVDAPLPSSGKLKDLIEETIKKS